MKHIIVLCFLLASFRQVFSQHINTEAITRFWEVANYLEHDRPLNDSLWNAYYNVHGNRAYMQNNRGTEQALDHRKYLELVFRPSLSDSLQAIEKRKIELNDDILDNLLYIKANEKQLRAYTSQVISPAYLKLCNSLARQYLPKGRFKSIPKNMTIYIMAMAYDAAVQDSSMYFGITRTYEYDKYRMGVLAAHELHHMLRVNKDLKNKVSPADSAGFTVVDQINNEGCADLIDKILLLDNPGKVFRGANFVHRVMDNADQAVMKLDSCFRVNAVASARFVTERQFNGILNYSSGHRPGLYMVNIIRRNGLEKELIAHNDNPFHLFYLYNQAAEKDNKKPPVFSTTAIEYLKALEKRVY